MTLELLLGIFGMIGILLAFVLDEFDIIHADSLHYNVLNLVGSGLLLYYAFALRGWPFLILNGIWFLVAGYKVMKELT